MEESFFYRIYVSPDGGLLYDLSSDLSEFVWEQRTNEPDVLTISVPDPFKVMGHALKEGMLIALELGTDQEHPLVFRGIIYTVESSFPGAGTPVVTLKAYDSLKELGMHAHSPPAWDDKPLSDVIKGIVQVPNYKFQQVTVALSADVKVMEVQIDKTDLQQLHDICDEFGCVFFVEPQLSGKDNFIFTDYVTLMQHMPPGIVLSHGRTGMVTGLTEFHGTVDADHFQVPYQLAGTDRRTGKPLAVVVRRPAPMGVFDDPFRDENLAAIEDSVKRGKIEALIGAVPAAAEKVKQLRLGGAEAEAVVGEYVMTTPEELTLNASNWLSVNANGMTGTGKTGGTPTLRTHMTVQLDDVGGRFSGTWFLTEVRHVVGRDGYHTEFSCKR